MEKEITMIQADDDFPIWDLSPPTIPLRTLLVALNPIGIGTPFVESLISYIMRLANIHRLSLHTFRESILKPFIKEKKEMAASEENTKRAIVLKKSHFTVSLNGANNNTLLLTQALEYFTGQKGLTALTLLPWENVLANLFLLRKKHAWCPACYNQWQKERHPIYQPLLWVIEAVKICPLHKVQLVEICPCCNTSSSAVLANLSSGHCSKCKFWLGECSAKSPLQIIDKELSEFHNWVAINIGELFSTNGKLSFNPTKEGFLQILEEMIDRLAIRNTRIFSEFVGIKYGVIFKWLKGSSSPTLNHLLKLSHRVNIPLKKILLGTGLMDESDWLNAAPAIEVGKWEGRIPHSKRKKSTRAEKIAVMESALNEEPPPSLEQLRDRIGYKSTESIYYLAPQLYVKIRRRHRAYQKQLKISVRKVSDGQINRIKISTAEIDKILDAELKKDYPLSNIEISRQIGMEASRLRKIFPEKTRKIFNKREAVKNQAFQNHLEKIQQQLYEIMAISPPLSFNDVAERFAENFSKYQLRRYFPEECGVIAKRSKFFQRESYRKEINRHLELAIQEIPPPSLKSLARHWGYSLSALTRNAPILSKEISKRFLKYRANRDVYNP